MKKSHIAWIVVAVVIGVVMIAGPTILVFGGIAYEIGHSNDAEIEIDSYRLCQDEDGDDVIIVKYLLKNDGDEPTALYYEGDFYVYQNGIGLSECVESLPEKCDYDPEDRFKNIKGGVEYYAEIAYYLEDADADVEVEVDDYSFFNNKKEKVFSIR